MWCNVRASPRGEAGRGAPAREAREAREVREAREARESRGAPERAAPPPAVFAYDRDEPDLYAEQYSPYVRYPAYPVTRCAIVALVSHRFITQSLFAVTTFNSTNLLVFTFVYEKYQILLETFCINFNFADYLTLRLTNIKITRKTTINPYPSYQLLIISTYFMCKHEYFVNSLARIVICYAHFRIPRF